jgi:hypothetical protein
MCKMITSAQDKIEPIQKSKKRVILIHCFNLLPIVKVHEFNMRIKQPQMLHFTIDL